MVRIEKFATTDDGLESPVASAQTEVIESVREKIRKPQSRPTEEEYLNPTFVRGLLDSKKDEVDYKMITIQAFGDLSFTYMGKGCKGVTLLGKHGGESSEALCKILNMAYGEGFRVYVQKLPPPDKKEYLDPTFIRGLLDSKKDEVDYKTIGFNVFKRLPFTYRGKGCSGQSLLIKYGNHSLGTVCKILNLAYGEGFRVHVQKIPKPDEQEYLDPAFIRGLLNSKKYEVDYKTISVNDFMSLPLTYMGKCCSGLSLLNKHGGSQLETLCRILNMAYGEGFVAYIQRRYVQRRNGEIPFKPSETEYLDPEFIRGLLDSKKDDVDYKTVGLNVFKRLPFTYRGKGCSGHTLVRRYGNQSLGTVCKILNLAYGEGFRVHVQKRKKPRGETLPAPDKTEYLDPTFIRGLLDSRKDEVDYKTIGVNVFRRLSFTYRGRGCNGESLLIKYGNHSLGTVCKILNLAYGEEFRVHVQKRKKPRGETLPAPDKTEYLDPEFIRGLLDSRKDEVDYKTINGTVFRRLSFTYRGKSCSGQTLFRKYGDQSFGTLYKILNTAYGEGFVDYVQKRYLRRGNKPSETEYLDPEFIRGLLDSKKDDVDYKTVGLNVFKRLPFTYRGKGCNGDTLLSKHGNQSFEALCKFLNMAYGEGFRDYVQKRKNRKAEELPDNKEYFDPAFIRGLLDSKKVGVDYRTIRVADFMSLPFTYRGKGCMGKTLLRKYGGTFSETLCQILNLAYGERFRVYHPSDPKKIRQHFEGNNENKEEVRDRNNVYRKLIENLGESAMTELLVAAHPEIFQNIRIALRGLRNYLGKFRTNMRPNIRDIPPYILELPSIRLLAFIKLRDYHFKGVFENQLSGLATLKEELALCEEPEHEQIYLELLKYYENVCTLPKQDCFVDRLSEDRDFPSLHQRMGMYEISQKRRVLIADDMRTGKTATAILGKEFVGAKKAIIVCPPHLVSTWEGRFSQYFKKEKQPKVAVISSENNNPEAWAKARDADYVIISYSMLATNKERHINKLKEMGFDYLVVDEVHNAKKPNEAGNGRSYTELIHELALQVDSIRKGYTVLLSGTPIPNKIKDIAAQLKILEPETYEDVPNLQTQIQRTNPLIVRNFLLRRMLRHQAHEVLKIPEVVIENQTYQEDEFTAELYDRILENEGVDVKFKLVLLQQLLLDPTFISPNATGVNQKFQRIVENIDRILSNKDKVVVCVHQFRDGILTPFKDSSSDDCMLRRLEEHYKGRVHFFQIDGKTTDTASAKDRVLSDFEAHQGKSVLFAQAQTIREGLEMSFVSDMININYPYVQADYEQLIARLRGEHQKEPRVNIINLISEGRIEEGIQRYALRKQQLINSVVEGRPLTRREWALVNSETQAPVNSILHFTQHTDSQKLFLLYKWLYQAGEAHMKEFLDDEEGFYAKEYARLYIKNWDESYSGDTARLVTSVLQEIEQSGLVQIRNVADLACGPHVMHRMLYSHPTANVIGVDMNRHQLVEGAKFLNQIGLSKKQIRSQVGQLSHLPFGSERFEVAVCSLALHYTALNPKKDNLERIETLKEMNRILKPDGVLLITLPSNIISEDMREQFYRELEHFGFKILTEYTGEVKSVDNKNGNKAYKGHIIALQKIGEVQEDKIQPENLAFSRLRRQVTQVKDGDGIKLIRPQINQKQEAHNEFLIHEDGQTKHLHFEMSDEDKQILKARENEVATNKKLRVVIDGLISQYRSCANIPKSVLNKHDLRLLSSKLQKKKTEYRIVRDSKKAAKGHAGATLYKEITK